MSLIPIGRPFRVAMAWQSAASAAVAVAAAVLAGNHGFLSAILGGGIGVVGVLASALVASRRPETAAAAVRIVVRAEAAKVIAIVLLLWWVFTAYRDMNVLAFFATFVVSVLLSGVAFAVSAD